MMDKCTNDVSIMEIWMADLPKIADSHLQAGIRPVIVVSNNKANKHSPVISIVPLTSKKKSFLPTHVEIQNECLKFHSTATCEQITSIDRPRLIRKLGVVSDKFELNSLKAAIKIQFSMEVGG